MPAIQPTTWIGWETSVGYFISDIAVFTNANYQKTFCRKWSVLYIFNEFKYIHIPVKQGVSKSYATANDNVYDDFVFTYMYDVATHSIVVL